MQVQKNIMMSDLPCISWDVYFSITFNRGMSDFTWPLTIASLGFWCHLSPKYVFTTLRWISSIPRIGLQNRIFWTPIQRIFFLLCKQFQSSLEYIYSSVKNEELIYLVENTNTCI